jgi:hypothetical protein
MGTILGMYNKFETLETEVISVEAVTETKEQIADLNIEQMSEGQDADGAKIGQYRNEEYAAMKFAMNPKAGFGNVDLKLTGAFVGGYYINVEADKIVEGSRDSKSAALEAKYGHIFGLNTSFRVEYIKKWLRPYFNALITERTGLKFGI